MSTRPDIPAEVMRVAEAAFELGASVYRSTPEMIGGVLVAQRALFVERIETKARDYEEARDYDDPAASSHFGAIRDAFNAFAADLRKEGWA